MSRVLFFDAFSGISGDMTVGSLLALGLDLERLRGELAALPVRGYALRTTDKLVHGIRARKFDVDVDASPDATHEHGHASAHAHHHAHRAYADIRRILA